MNKKKVFFIGHEASRTGAPIVLMHLLRWLKKNTDLELELAISHTHGYRYELIQEYREICKTVPLSLDFETPYEKATRIIYRSSKLQRVGKKIASYVKKKGFDLIYSNSAGNGRLLPYFQDLNIPIILHLHELKMIHQLFPDMYENSLKYSSAIIAASTAVEKYITHDFGYNSKKITVIHEFIDFRGSIDAYQENRQRVRNELGVQENEKLICGSGTVDFRKGVDIFIQVAHKALQQNPNLKFVWVGHFTLDWIWIFLMNDLEKLGIADRVRFIGARKDPFDYFAASDIFLMCSREDPFPLVNIENAAIGNPIICFDKSGGSVEMVGNDGGIVVPYMDINAMASAIIKLSENDDMRKKMGKYVQERALKNFLTEIQSPKIYEVIKKYL